MEQNKLGEYLECYCGRCLAEGFGGGSALLDYLLLLARLQKGE